MHVFPLFIGEPVVEKTEETAVSFKHTPALDGVRGIAVLLVMIHHLSVFLPSLHQYVKGGFLGVDIFFVLSGFLITSILLREYEETSTLNLKNFYVRRSLRLVPAFWLFLICLFFFGIYLLPEFQATLIYGRHDFVYAITYTLNWFCAYNTGYESNLGHIWSIAIEEQFYILWSLILYWAFSRKIGKEKIFYVTLGLVATLCISRAVRAVGGTDLRILYYSTDTRIDAILIGCAASMAFIWRIVPLSFLRTRGFKALCFVSLAAALAVLLSFSGEDPGLYITGLPVFTVSIALLLYWLVSNQGTIVHTLLEDPLLRWIGNISYGLYLWHRLFYEFAKNTFVAVGMQILIGITMTFVVSIISYYFLEQPFLRLKSRFNFKPSKA